MSADGTAAIARTRALLEQVAFAAHLGLHVDEVDGGPVLVLPATEAHIGDAARGSVHGGLVAAVLELAAWLHLRVDAPAAGDVEAVDFTSAFVREVRLEDLFVHATTVRRGRRFAHVRVEAWQRDRHGPVAAGQGTFGVG